MGCMPMKCIPMTCTPKTCTPVRYRHTPERYAYERYARELHTPVRYTPMRHPPIRCTLVGCMPVRYFLIFESSFVVLDAEPGLAGMSVLAAAALIASNSRMCLWPQVSVEYACPETFRGLLQSGCCLFHCSAALTSSATLMPLSACFAWLARL